MMSTTVFASGPSWLSPHHLIGEFGLIGILVIVFTESGLPIGFLLPGDSLLFTTGLLVTTGGIEEPLWLVCLLVVAAAILGDQAGYLLGRKAGPAVFKRSGSRLFREENLRRSRRFFDRHGKKSIILARFVSVIRTFTPIVAGMSGMDYRSFLTYNVIGGIIWGAGLTLLGAGLGTIAFVREHLELIIIAIVLLAALPIVTELLRSRSKKR